MGLASRTLRNSVLVVGARALAKVLVFVVLVLLWRHLGSEGYGRFAAMVVYASLFGIVADLGLQTVFVRDVSRDREAFDRYLSNLLSARLLLSLVALALLAGALRLLAPDLFPATLGGFALLLTTSYSSLLRAVFYIRRRLSYEAVAILMEGILLLGLTLYAIGRHARWDAFLWVYAAGYLFTAIFAFAVIRIVWKDHPKIRFEPAFLRRVLLAGAPLAVGFTLTTVYAQVDVVLLQVLKGFKMVAWYSAANKYVDAVAWIPQSAMGAIFPVLSMLSAGGAGRLAVAYEKSYKMLAILAVPLAIGMSMTAPQIVRLTPGGFEQSIPALQLLGPSVALVFVNNAFIYTLTALNRQADFTRLAIGTLLVNLILNAALIPPFGYLGAAAASTLTEVALFSGGWWLVRRRLYRLPAARSIGRILLSGLVMGISVLVLRAQPLPVLVLVGGAVYCGCLVAFRALSADEWAVLRAGLLRR